jgi:hypothetical protein
VLAVGFLLAGALLPAARPRSVARGAAAAGGAPPEAAAAVVNLLVVAPLDEMSKYGVTWREVLEHTATRLTWSDPLFKLAVVDSGAAAGPADAAAPLRAALAAADVALALHVQDPAAAAALAPLLLAAPTAVAVDSAGELASLRRVGGRDASPLPPAQGLAAPLRAVRGIFDGGAAARAKEDRDAAALVEELYGRYTSDDLLFCFLILINQAVYQPGSRPVPAVANSTTGQGAGAGTLQCMVSKCGKEIVSCVGDATCRTALGCLQACRFNDQVCSYRCIASYESPQLEAFSLCILQKHNCLGLSADIPAVRASGGRRHSAWDAAHALPLTLTACP